MAMLKPWGLQPYTEPDKIMTTENPILCPSAQPDWQGSRVIGVMVGSADKPEMAYLEAAQPVSAELLEMVKPYAPTEVFRFSAPCANQNCGHFSPESSKCRLAEKIVRWAPVVVDHLPVCAIRADCRWWRQEGKTACARCPPASGCSAASAC